MPLPPGVTPREPQAAALPPGVTPSRSEAKPDTRSTFQRVVTDPAANIAGMGLEALTAAGVPWARLAQGEGFRQAFDPRGMIETIGAGGKAQETRQEAAKAGVRTGAPVAAAALTGGMALPAIAGGQLVTEAMMQATGVSDPSRWRLLASALLPFLPAAVVRGARGLGRTATRVAPGLFRRAQEGAQVAAGQVAKSVGPAQEAGALFKSARAAGDEIIPAAKLQAMIDDLDQAIPADPVSPGLKTAREFMDAGRKMIRGGGITLRDLMRFRQDLGPMTRQIPQVQALYKATLSDLEAGGSAGSRLAVQALESARKTHGASLFTDLVEKATDVRSISGADVPALNVAKLAKAVQTHKDDLLKFLGPRGFGQIEQFLITYRSLPPTHAWTAVNRAIGTIAGGLGFFGGAGAPGLAAAAVPELATNIYAVGANPAWVNRTVPAAVSLGNLAQEALRQRR